MWLGPKGLCENMILNSLIVSGLPVFRLGWGTGQIEVKRLDQGLLMAKWQHCLFHYSSSFTLLLATGSSKILLVFVFVFLVADHA